MKSITGFIFLICFTAISAFGQPLLLKQFQNHFNQTQTFVSDFTQYYYDAMLEQSSEASGKVFYKKTGLMHWDYEDPDLMQIIIGKKKIWIYEPDLENVTIQYLDQVSRMDALSFLLKNEAMEKHFVTTTPENSLLDKFQNSKSLYLKPKKDSQHIFELQLAVHKHTFEIMQFILIDQQRNHRKISFKNMVINVEIPDSKFEFIVTEGMEVIDEMDN